MLITHTGDPATDSNLTKLRCMAEDTSTTPQAVQNLAELVIGICEMFPAKVRSALALPSAYIGSGAYDWKEDRRSTWLQLMRTSIISGVDRVLGDSTFADLDVSDRPRSRGEVILEAAAQFQKSLDMRDFVALEASVSGTHMTYRASAISKLMQVKRPKSGQSIAGEIYGELSRLRSEASSFHHVKG